MVTNSGSYGYCTHNIQKLDPIGSPELVPVLGDAAAGPQIWDLRLLLGLHFGSTVGACIITNNMVPGIVAHRRQTHLNMILVLFFFGLDIRPLVFTKRLWPLVWHRNARICSYAKLEP